jgi:putative ABC transport system permease protein
MIRNYLTIAFRSLWRTKATTFINIVGLSLGVACCILISLFVYDEWTFDTFNRKAYRIYRVFGHENWGPGQNFFYTVTPFPMGPVLKESFGEIESQVRIAKQGTLVKVGGNSFNETLTIADHNIFEVFDFPLVNGVRSQVLAQQSNVVISDWLAKKYFGDADPVGKMIEIQIGEAFEDFTITGVSKIPSNSSIQFYLLIGDQNLPRLYSEQDLTSAWFNIIPETYVLLREGVDPRKVTDKFPSVFKTILGEEEFANSHYAPGLQPLTSIHLDPGYPAGLAPVNDPKYATILGTIALLILVVACINFVTLSIGRSMNRAKEVGIRKVVGAIRSQLIAQFISEAVLVTFVAMLAGLALADLNLPLFNELAGKKLLFPYNGFMVLLVLVLLLIIGLVAGSYPAFFLSGFKPIAVLKGAPSSGTSKQGLRKALVSVQLVLAVFLISSTLVMQKQFRYLQNKNLGFNKEQLAVVQINVPRNGRLVERIMTGFKKADQLKAELPKFPDVEAVCATSHDFANGNWTNIGYTDDTRTYRTFNMNVVDANYIPVLNMDLVKGRNFLANNASDKSGSVIVNEAFVRDYGWDDPIGKRIPGKRFGKHEIIGVVKDFNYSSLYSKVQPLAIVEDPSIILQGSENVNIDSSPIPKIMVRLRAGNMAIALDQIKKVWEKFTGGEEFAFTFVDQALAAQYRSDQNLGKIVGIATLLAILIGCLGLYGLATLSMRSKVKEISIRKILGATQRSLLLLLSKEYVALILFSLSLSIPLTLYMMQDWLATFAYHISIGWEVFAIAGLVSLMIALLTISYQTLRTTWTQPAETLKCE